MISFNQIPYTGREDKYINEFLTFMKSGKAPDFISRCHQWFKENYGLSKALLTPSCTHALEMSAILCDIHPGDEVIMPSYTFVSTANAFVMRGAQIVFIDIRPDTMNIDETLIEDAVTGKTKAIVPVHYAGVGCEMDSIMEIAERNKLLVVEDAAQGMMSRYKGSLLGSIGHIAAYSFHGTKNYSSGGEGGLFAVNESSLSERAEIIREKGTDRSKFLRGEVDKYSWCDIGSSYLISEIQAAYLYGQLVHADDILKARLGSWDIYYNLLREAEKAGNLSLPHIPEYCDHNAHMFYIKTDSYQERDKLAEHMQKNGFHCVSHYVPLHSSIAGKKYSRFHGADRYTTVEAGKLLRLPFFYGLANYDIEQCCEAILSFYR